MEHLLHALEARQPLTASDNWCRENGYKIPVPKPIYRLSDLIDWMSDYNIDQVHFSPQSQDIVHTYTLGELLRAENTNL